MTLRHRVWIAVFALAAACSRSAFGTGDEAVTTSSTQDASPARTEDGGAMAPSAPPSGFDAGAPTPEPDAAAPEACASVEASSTLERLPIDVVWVIDDSGSMADEQQRIRENIAGFASKAVQAGVDIHVVMLTRKDLAQGTQLAGDARYTFLSVNVGSHNALDVLLANFSKYKTSLRDKASTHFVVVTDDESDLAGQSFQNQMKVLLGHDFVLHAIASENQNGRACRCAGVGCGAAAPGDIYYALAAATGGQQVSICTSDWGAVFDKLLSAVIQGAPLPCAFDLPMPSNGETLDPMRVTFAFDGMQGKAEIPKLAGGSCGALSAWQFDDAQQPRKIVLCPKACEALSSGGKVRIALGCMPMLIQ